MRKIFLGLILIAFPYLSFCQENTQETLAKLYITEGTDNGTNISNYLLEQKAFLAFYTINKQDLYLANFRKMTDSQSVGRVYKTDESESVQLDSNSKLYMFNWDYINSYDSDSGTASIQYIEVITPSKRKVFELKINTNDKELIYRGYIKGDFDLSMYLKEY